VPLTVSFSPTVSGGYRGSDNLTSPIPCPDCFSENCFPLSKTFSGSYLPQWIGNSTPSNNPAGPYVSTLPQRVTLVDSSGNIVQNPQNNLVLCSSSPCNCGVAALEWGFTLKPLTQKPVLELVALWQLLSVNRCAANTTTTYSQTVTYGVTQSSTTAFTNTFNASAGLDIKGFKATLSYAFSAEVTNSMSITQTTETTNSFTVNPGNKQGVLAIWQLVYQIVAVRNATASEIAAGHDQFGNSVDPQGYVAFSDPNFVQGTTNAINPNDVAPVGIQQETDIVPQLTLF
jgi:hypothetical protein